VCRDPKEVSNSMLKRFTSHTLMALAEGALIALLIVGLVAGTALAGKGKPSGGGTSSIAMVPVPATDAVTTHGDQVTFNVSTTATTQPMVKLECFQGGTLVYTASAGFYPDYPWQWAQIFTLESSVWTSGAADCTGTLYFFNGRRYSNLSTTTFNVGA